MRKISSVKSDFCLNNIEPGPTSESNHADRLKCNIRVVGYTIPMYRIIHSKICLCILAGSWRFCKQELNYYNIIRPCHYSFSSLSSFPIPNLILLVPFLSLSNPFLILIRPSLAWSYFPLPIPFPPVPLLIIPSHPCPPLSPFLLILTLLSPSSPLSPFSLPYTYRCSYIPELTTSETW